MRVPRISTIPAGLVAAWVVGVALGPLLLGLEPIGDDPDLLYRPIKVELSRALRAGTWPFWSDRFGLGIPLIAESHAAAFYPPNAPAYRFLEPSTAYRWLMWLHYVATAVATFAYARALKLGRPGAILAAMSFTLCGFQAIHACHEPFYCLMPFLPLCLLLTEQYLETGRTAWLAGLALAWGVQVTIGHFQIQMWTAGLVLLTGGWRIASSRLPLHRGLGLVAALFWGAAIASIQLVLTWELTRIAGFARPPRFLMNYVFPPSHWAQLALPGLYLGQPGMQDPYWGEQWATPGEAAAYVGTVPLILAFVGWIAARRDRGLTPWRLMVPLGFVLASMSRWWPEGFGALLMLPGLGWFRAPGRYMLLTCLGLALLAGRGFDRAIAPRRFGIGMALAIGFGLAAFGWSVHRWRTLESFRESLGETASLSFGIAALAWVLSLAALIAWRRGRVGPWLPIVLTSIELVGLFYSGPVAWEWPVQLDQSPILRRLAEEPAGGLVAGRLLDLPVRIGRTSAFPTLGITPPPPNYLLESTRDPHGRADPISRFWQRLFGVSHGVWTADDPLPPGDAEVLLESPDAALSRLIRVDPSDSPSRQWILVRYSDAFPNLWIARRLHEVPSWEALYTGLPGADLKEQAWILSEDLPPEAPDPDAPAARSARVRGWNGREAIVEHDGPCILVVRRTYYPGWFYRINAGPAHPVLKVDGGLQGITIPSAGTSRVSLFYRPTALPSGWKTSLAAVAAAMLLLGIAALRHLGPWKAGHSGRKPATSPRSSGPRESVRGSSEARGRSEHP